MDSLFLNLNHIVNLEKFQKIQDHMAAATDMAIISVDYRGMPVTKHSQCSDLCKIIRSHPSLGKLCQKCDSRGGLEAARMMQPYIYLCHMGIVDFAVPIIVEDQYLGAVMAGQVLLHDDKGKAKLEQILQRQYGKSDLPMRKTLEEQYKKLPVMTLDKVKAVACMLFQINNYIIEEAIIKTKLNEVIQKYEIPTKVEEYSGKQNTSMKNGDFVLRKSLPLENSVITPAINYIQNYYYKKLHLTDMANMCNICSSYFSKLFRKQLTDNFSNYVNKIRVEKATEMLKTTNSSIINISLSTGFEDCGYFIKVFKKIEGITPTSYRMRHAPKENYSKG